MDFTELVDLASERLGGAVLYANDEFFAPKENLLKPSMPIFVEGKYTERGKWMDGWETRRRRTPGFDWCLVRLGLPGIVRGLLVDTAYFKGNYPARCSLDACTIREDRDLEPLLAPESETLWTEILPPTDLQGDSRNFIPVRGTESFTHLRFKIYPDGGVARLRVYGEVVPDLARLRDAGEVDLVAVENGGLVVAASDMFFGHRHNLIMPGRSVSMSDGWETQRRRGEGNDWVVVKLCAKGMVKSLEIDTAHFKGNYPESCSLEACDATGVVVDGESIKGLAWREVLPRVRLQAHTRHLFGEAIKEAGEVTHVRLQIYPDGGVSRLRVYGRVAGSEV